MKHGSLFLTSWRFRKLVEWWGFWNFQDLGHFLEMSLFKSCEGDDTPGKWYVCLSHFFLVEFYTPWVRSVYEIRVSVLECAYGISCICDLHVCCAKLNKAMYKWLIEYSSSKGITWNTCEEGSITAISLLIEDEKKKKFPHQQEEKLHRRKKIFQSASRLPSKNRDLIKKESKTKKRKALPQAGLLTWTRSQEAAPVTPLCSYLL